MRRRAVGLGAAARCENGGGRRGVREVDRRGMERRNGVALRCGAMGWVVMLGGLGLFARRQDDTDFGCERTAEMGAILGQCRACGAGCLQIF